MRVALAHPGHFASACGADTGPGEGGPRVTSVARKKHALAFSRPRSEYERDPCLAETPLPASPHQWSQPEAALGLRARGGCTRGRKGLQSPHLYLIEQEFALYTAARGTRAKA